MFKRGRMKKTLLLFAALALLLSSCSILPNRALASARNRWRNANVSHYRYNLAVGCFCAFTQKMPLTVEVQNGALRSMVYRDGMPVSAEEMQIFAPYSTIDNLFGFTAETLRKADDVKAGYDATYGFPANVQIDFIRNAADDELTLTVTNFQPLPQ